MVDEELAIGIDLGTTFSCVAVLKNNRVEIIPNENGENITPSVVSFTDNGILVGEKAVSQLILNPKKTVYCVKRLMGKNYDDKNVIGDIQSNFYNYTIKKQEGSTRPAIEIIDKYNNTNYYLPEHISKLILQKLIQNAKAYLNTTISKAVITVPAYFNDAQRNATKLAAEQAGLEVLRIINEPTAASLAYGLEKKLPKTEKINLSLFEMDIQSNNEGIKKSESRDDDDNKSIIVFDLGGGTFDVTLLKIRDGDEIFDIRATSGDPHLGGDDFDQKISEYCIQKFCTKYDINKDDILKDTQLMNRLKIASEKAKIQLSTELNTVIEIDDFYNDLLLKEQLNRELFEDTICKDLFERLLKPLDMVLDDEKISKSDIDEIVFVGGSTRIPKIKKLIKDYFPSVNINDSINPDETVAYGAAIQAAKLMQQGNDILNDIILMDITPFSLGTSYIKQDQISNNNNIKYMDFIIPRGSKLPIRNKKCYNSVADNQERMVIDIYEGESRYVMNNQLLGNFYLTNLPKMPKGQLKVEITLQVDSDGILNVTAEETSQGIKGSITIINDKELNQDEIIKNIYNNRATPLTDNDNKKIINFKKEMNKYYINYKNANNNLDKYKYVSSFSENLKKFLDTFEKEGNDTLGNKYFLYIKVLFDTYRTLIKLTNVLDENEKNSIIQNSKKYLEILSKFKNINYKNYIELLNLFVVNLNKEQKEKSLYEQKNIEESRNSVLFDLVIYVMELIKQKAENNLAGNSKFARFNSKYLFNNCIQISELFIKNEIDLEQFEQIKNRYKEIIEKCKVEIKKINANSLIEIDKIKSSNKLFENTNNLDREELLIILDNYREALRNMEAINDIESEAIILANIVKINYIYLKNKNYSILKTEAQNSISRAMSTGKNVESFRWYIEISNLLEELRNKLREIEEASQANFEEKIKNDKKEIFQKIDDALNSSNNDFVKYILKTHPPKRNPFEGKNIDEEVDEKFKKNAKDLFLTLSGRYNPDHCGLKKKTDDEKYLYTIYHYISNIINSIIEKLSPPKEFID